MIALLTETGLGSTLMLAAGIAAIIWFAVKGERR